MGASAPMLNGSGVSRLSTCACWYANCATPLMNGFPDFILEFSFYWVALCVLFVFR